MPPKKGDNILKSTIDRVEQLIEERKGINSDISDIYAEAKIHGLKPKWVREVIRLRSLKKEELEERSELLAQYGDALGMDLL